MKINITLIIIALLATASAGCQGTKVILRPASTNDVPVLSTNAVEVVKTELNPVAGLPEITTTNLVLDTVTNIVRVIVPEVAYTNLVIKPVAQTVAAIGATAVPGPWSAVVGLGTTLFVTVLAGISEARRRKALGQVNHLGTVATTLVENFETLRKAALEFQSYKSIDKTVMDKVHELQRTRGVKTDIHDLVEDNT